MRAVAKHALNLLEYSLITGGIGAAVLIVCLPLFWILGFSWQPSTASNFLSFLFGAPIFLFLFPTAIPFWLGIYGTTGAVLGFALVPLFWGALACITRCSYRSLRVRSSSFRPSRSKQH